MVLNWNSMIKYSCIRKTILSRDLIVILIFLKLLQNHSDHYNLFKYLISTKFELKIAIKKLFILNYYLFP